MKKVINITSNGIKQAIDDLVNENEILQDNVYKLEEQLQQKENIIKEVREKIRYWQQDYIETYISTDELDEILEILDKGE